MVDFTLARRARSSGSWPSHFHHMFFRFCASSTRGRIFQLYGITSPSQRSILWGSKGARDVEQPKGPKGPKGAKGAKVGDPMPSRQVPPKCDEQPKCYAVNNCGCHKHHKPPIWGYCCCVFLPHLLCGRIGDGRLVHTGPLGILT